MAKATREIHWKTKVFHPGDELPDDPTWMKAWIEAGSAAAETPAPPAPALEAEMEEEPGEEVLAQEGTQLTDRLPTKKPPSKKKAK